MGGIVGVYLSFGFLVIYEIVEIFFRAMYVAVDFKVSLTLKGPPYTLRD